MHSFALNFDFYKKLHYFRKVGKLDKAFCPFLGGGEQKPGLQSEIFKFEILKYGSKLQCKKLNYSLKTQFVSPQLSYNCIIQVTSLIVQGMLRKREQIFTMATETDNCWRQVTRY